MLFPPDWLDPRSADGASDLDLAVLLVNTVDHLEPEPDRLRDLRWLRAAFTETGRGALATQLSDRDLEGLRRLRDDLRAVFEDNDERAIAARLNDLLDAAGAVALLEPLDPGLRLSVGLGRSGLAALQTRLPAAVAAYVAEHGVGRLGTCAGDPCSCAFVDRTRAGTRRYCCTYCNDRMAARAYRRRRQGGS